MHTVSKGSISFTNLHICEAGWSVTGHQKTGEMNTWDLSKCPEEMKERICKILSDMIGHEASIHVEHISQGLQ